MNLNSGQLLIEMIFYLTDYMCDHPTQLTSHKRIIHEEKLEPLECAHCPLQVRTQPELDKHLRNIHR